MEELQIEFQSEGKTVKHSLEVLKTDKNESSLHTKDKRNTRMRIERIPP